MVQIVSGFRISIYYNVFNNRKKNYKKGYLTRKKLNFIDKIVNKSYIKFCCLLFFKKKIFLDSFSATSIL